MALFSWKKRGNCVAASEFASLRGKVSRQPKREVNK